MPTPHGRLDTFVVDEQDAGRLDRFLVRRLPECSRREARTAIASNAVWVNGRPGLKGQTLRSGDVVGVDRAAFGRTLAPQGELPVVVLYEDAAVVAVDKPAGMPAVALRATDRDTVANFLVARYPEVAAIGASAFECGLVHRLDTGTSGVLLAARDGGAWRRLRHQFRRGTVDKLYLAVVAGEIGGRGTIDAAIAHAPRRPRRMQVCADPRQARGRAARPALSRYRCLQRLHGASLVAVRIFTGVRHQIRVHLAWLGHPVLGDRVYGGALSSQAAPRLLLHAARLAFTHPADGRRIVVRSRPPADFRAASPR